MAYLSLFGSSADVDTSSVDIQYSDGLRVTARLNVARNRLSLVFAGRFGVANFTDLRTNVPCSITGGHIVLGPNPVPSTGRIVFQLPGLSQPVDAPAAIPASLGGLAFVSSTRLVDDCSRAVVAGEFGSLMAANHSSWQRTACHFDEPSGTVTFRPDTTDPESIGYILRDRFRKSAVGTSPRVEVSQRLVLRGVSFSDTSVRVDIRAHKDVDAVFVHPDMLDVRDLNRGTENGFLYQFGLVGGIIRADLTWNSGWSAVEHRYTKDTVGPAQIVALALRDGHGHPIVLQADAFPLCVRAGEQLAPPAANPAHPGWSRTNQAVVIGRRSASSFAVDLHSLDPIELYGRDRSPPPLTSGAIATRPYWVSGGRAPVLPEAPAGLHGFSRNAALRRPMSAAPAGRPLRCMLVADPVTSPLGDPLYMRTHLELPVEDRRLQAEVPEEAIFPRASVSAVEVKKREAQPIPGKTARIPLLDTRWSLSNLSGLPGADGWSPAGDGVLARAAAAWIAEMDATLASGPSSAFESPLLDAYQHARGHRTEPSRAWFSSVLAQPPASTRRDGAAPSRAPTALREPVITPFASASGHAPALVLAAAGGHLATTTPETTKFVFGGGAPVGDLWNNLKQHSERLAPLAEAFLRRWCGLDMPESADEEVWWQTLRVLKDVLAGGALTKLVDPASIQDPDEQQKAEDEIEAQLAAVAGFFADLEGQNLPPELELEMQSEFFDNLLLPEFIEWWNEICETDEEGSAGRLLLDMFRSPPNLEIVRRAVAAAVNPKLSKEVFDKIDPRAWTYFTTYILPADLKSLVDAIFNPKESLDGFLADLHQGLDEWFKQAADIWKDDTISALDDLRHRYGPRLTEETYNALTLAQQDAEIFLQVLRAHGIILKRLADLLSEPPDYAIITRRFRRPDRSGAEDDATSLHPVHAPGARLWSARYNLCSFGGAKAWDFFLDDKTTVVLKLGGRRGLEEILTEAQAAYLSDDRPNPLGIPFSERDGRSPLRQLLDDLPPELKDPDWRGALVISPSIDLGRDSVLSTLCGFKYLPILWVAVGGQKPNLAEAAIDVWAHIKRDTEPGPEPKVADPYDVTWALITLDVTVRGTVVQAGEIAFRLDLNELLGASGKTQTWQSVTVRATLPPPSDADVGKPRAFTFAATFERPQEFSIKLAFLDKLDLRGVRVGSHSGQVTLDVDADLWTRDYNVGAFKIPGSPQPLRLQDFRVLIPELPPGESLAMGLRRALHFDLPAIRIPAVSRRQLTLLGVEITPVGFRLLRGTEAEIRSIVEKDLRWVIVPNFGGGGRFTFPMVELRIDFGALPVFGGGSRLELAGAIGLPVRDGTLSGSPGFGIASLSGRDIRFDLFRLLTVNIEELDIGTFDRMDPDSGARRDPAGVLSVKQWDLRILDWSLLKDYGKDFLLAHDTKDPDSKGMLLWGARSSAVPPDGFFRLYWALLSRNLDVGKKLKDNLLDRSQDAGSLDQQVSIINKILVDPGGGANKVLNARFGDGREWIFGVRFALGELFEYCTLVLHDGHYYGIGLRAPWLQPLIGMEEITFSYIPGNTPQEDRFRTSFRIAALEFVSSLRSGTIALEWSPNWDFLIDIGYPWRTPAGYDWFRAFSIPAGIYEAKFGFFIEKRMYTGENPLGLPPGRYLTVAAGFGFYFGYYFEANGGIAWVRAGIGMFGIVAGRATLKLAEKVPNNALAVLRGSIAQLEIIGVVGIFAYGEAGVEYWIISARFRVSAQAALTVQITYQPGRTVYVEFDVTLSASYSASVRVGSGWFSYTFTVSGSIGIPVAGRTALG